MCVSVCVNKYLIWIEKRDSYLKLRAVPPCSTQNSSNSPSSTDRSQRCITISSRKYSLGIYFRNEVCDHSEGLVLLLLLSVLPTVTSLDLLFEFPSPPCPVLNVSFITQLQWSWQNSQTREPYRQTNCI